MSEISTVSVRRLAELESQGKIELIDVRTPAEYREVHAANAKKKIPADRR